MLSTTDQFAFVTLLDSPEDVERDVNDLIAQRRRMVERLVEIIDPQNRGEYNDKQRAGAAILLGELRAPDAIPFLVEMLKEEVHTDFGPITDLNPFILPAYNALGNIGRPILPSMVEIVKTTDDQKLRKSALGLMLSALGTKRFLLDVLDRLAYEANLAKDRSSATRLRQAHAYAESHFTYSEGEPIL